MRPPGRNPGGFLFPGFVDSCQHVCYHIFSKNLNCSGSENDYAMDSSKTILFSDFDGTLFNSAGHVSQENRDAIACYVENGGMFAVATGRTPSNALQYLGGVCINAPSIMLNGAAVYDFNAKQYLMASHLDQEKMVPVLRRVLERVPEADLLIYNEELMLFLTNA